MAAKVGLCVLCLFLVSVLCDESCLKRSERFLSMFGMQIDAMEKGIMQLSTFTKDVVWNSMQMEMRLRLLKLEMEAFQQSSTAAIQSEQQPAPIISSAAATASASAMAQASAAAASSSVAASSNVPMSSNSCSLQQLLQDQFKGNVLIEIKAPPTASPPAEATVPIVKDKVTKIGDLSSCSQANTTGLYRLWLAGNSTMDVLCDAEFDKGGWVVIQHRFNGTEEFYRNWTDYQDGFGKLNEEFWLGNENIYMLTRGQPREIAFLMEDFEGNKGMARYAKFQLGDAAEKYTLKSLGPYSGTAGDSLSRNVGSKFSTHDMDNDKSSSHCAQLYVGGWWYDDCHLSNLNGKYMKGPTTIYAKSMCWSSFKGFNYSLKISRIMVRY